VDRTFRNHERQRALHDLSASDSFTVRPGRQHIHPWNIGDVELRFRQTDTFSPADASAAVDTFLAFSTMFGLAAEGKADHNGIPRNPLQLMVMLDFFRLYGGYVPGAPIALQDVMMRVGGALGRALGYRAWYERYLPQNRTGQ
jgi:hypothetical protein